MLVMNNQTSKKDGAFPDDCLQNPPTCTGLQVFKTNVSNVYHPPRNLWYWKGPLKFLFDITHFTKQVCIVLLVNKSITHEFFYSVMAISIFMFFAGYLKFRTVATHLRSHMHKTRSPATDHTSYPIQKERIPIRAEAENKR